MDIVKLLKHFLSATAMRLVSSLLSFLLIGYIARTWEVAQLGQFSTLFSLFLFLLQIPLLGLHVVLIREIAVEPDKTKSYTTTALILSLCVSVFLAAIVIAFGVNAYPEVMLPAMLWIAASTVFMAVTAVVEATLIAKEKMPVVVWGTVIENLFRVGMGFLLVHLGYGITPIMACFFIGRLLALVVYQYLANIRGYLEISQFSGEILRLFFSKIPTVFVILLLSVIVGRFDFILLSILGSMQEVGLYSPAFKIYEMGLMVPSMMTVVIYPTLARFFERDKPSFDQLYTNLVRLIVVLGVPALGVLAYFSSDIITLFFGEAYSETGFALQLLLAALLLITVDQILIATTYAAKRDDLELMVLAVTCAVYLVLLVILIPSMGYIGAAIATFSAAVTKLLVRYAVVAKKLVLPSIRSSMLGPILGFLVAGGLLLSDILPGAVANIAGALLVYTLMLALFKGVTMNDVRFVQKLVGE